MWWPGYCGEGSSTISLHLGIHGHAITYCSGCASGSDAIGYAARMIQGDDVDVVVAAARKRRWKCCTSDFAVCGP
jgi:3-oxoacyl-(acyl-carrier-protein) synthase